MSSCDNNASASNHTLTNETKLNEDYNNEQKNHLILTTTTTTTTSSSSSSSSSLLEGAKNADVNDKKEPIDFLNPDENQILNLDLEETATVISAEATTTNIFDNAEALTITPATALVSGNKMLPTPAQPATTKPEEKNEANSSNQDELSLEAAEATSVAATSVAATAVAATAVAATAVAATTYSEDKRVTAAAPASLPITALTDCTTSREAESSQTSGVAAAFPLQQTQGQSACDEPREAVTVNLSPTPVLINTTEPAQETAPAAASPETPPTTPTASHLPQIASEPTFGIILRRNQQEQQQRFRNRHDVRFEGTSVSIENVTTPSGGYRSGVSVSASASPSMGRKSSDASMLMSRRVSFPKSDNELVTGYLEPANPWEHACLVKSISEIAELYVMSCSKHNTKPLQTILDHLKMVELNKTLRQPLLSLKSIKLAPSDCEALEEVFKRVQYKAVDLSSCELTETAAMALFEMIEYYEAANELDISLNACGMTHRGWTSCTYMISHSQALQVLNAQGNPISRTGAENLGHALCTSNLHTIKLEHCGLRGAPLSGLCFKLRSNRVLRELWLAYNDLDCYDAENIAKLLTVNHYLQLIDISNNNIRDEGLKKIVKALITQARELEKHSLLQRAPAIDDDDCGDNESVGSSSDTENSTISCNSTNNKHETNETNSTNVGGLIVESDASQSEDTDDEAFENEKAKKSSNDSEAQLMAIATTGDKIESVATITTAVVPTTETDVLTPLTTTLSTDELDADEEDTEDTMKSTPSTTLKNSTSSAGNGNGGGQSMLDKLLSMNSTESSSSDDIGSNLSTDTLAACCSEDASLISDDIFDGGAATATSTTNTSTNSTALSKGNLAPTPSATANETISSVLTTELDKERREATSDTSNGESSNTESNSSGLSSATSSMSTNSNSNNTNTNNNNNNSNINSNNQHPLHAVKSELNASPCVFELTAEENDCLISSPVTKALDVNKNTAKLMDDFDDTHSTDSAFESASEGDISRHLPEEFSRLSASFESSRIDEVIAASKEFAGVETATIATESTECLVTAAAAASSSSLSCETITTAPLIEMATQVGSTSTVPPTPTTLAAATIAAAVSPVVIRLEDRCDNESLSEVECNPLPPIPPKVTISEDSLYLNKTKLSSIGSPSPTPPPPSTSPGGASVGMRRTESSCAFITPSTRIRSQSSDSLCSDTSLDGSLSSDINFSTSTQINEKLAKNDTLTRQQRQFEAPAEVASKAPCGLKALALWNNNLTRESGQYIAELLAETPSLELLNIGKNCLSNDFISTIKDSLMRNTTLTTLGLQSAHLSAKGIETLSSILTFGGNCTLQRIDIRDNKLEVESLSTLAEVLKSNTTVTQIDIDDEPKRLSFEKLRITPFVSVAPPAENVIGSDAHLDYARVLENVRSMCSRNEKTQSQLQAADKTAALTTAAGRRRSGYYLGSRKISLTCHTRPIVVDNPKVDSSISITATAHSKLDVKRKTGARLRSPIPSPPTVSPSSSPSRSRFKVFRVSEVSPLTSPMSVTPMIATTTSSVAIPSTSTNSNNNLQKQQSTSLPSASSLSFMATVTSSTESIKRYSVSPRSRFQVSKIYEDPRLPLTDRPLPPISPPATSSPAPVVDSSHTVSSFSASAANTQLNAVKENDHKDHMPTTLDATTLVTPPRAAIVTTVSEVASTELSPIPNFESTKEATNTNVTNSNKTIINTTNTNTANSNATNKNITKTITKDSNVDSSHSYKSTLSPISSASSASSSSSSSSSSSTSPASISSNSSIISASSSSSTESPITPLFSDNTDSDPAQASKDLLPNIGARCPIAVFDENEITLTKNSSNAVRSGLSAQHTESSSSAPVSGTSTPQQQPMQSRVRKTSWLGNPAAVDKLLTLFHNPGTIFQRSSSPDSNLTTSSSTTTQQEVNQPTVQQKSLVPTRKTSPPTWSKLGNEMMRPVTSALQQTINTGEASSAAVLTTTAEQSISFLDAASKQICDFSKQVFRQNLAFGNETNAFGAAGGMVGMQVSSSGSVANSALPEQLDAAHIPSDVQLEIKENISPEHTITDETLHSLQKHCLAAVSSAVSNNNSSALQEPLLEERRVEEAREQQLQVLPLSSSSNSNSNTLMPTVSASNNSVQHEEQQSAKTQTS